MSDKVELLPSNLKPGVEKGKARMAKHKSQHVACSNPPTEKLPPAIVDRFFQKI